MPYYLFQNNQTGEVKEIFQHMNDSHVYSEGEVQFTRLFTKPQAAIDTKWDANSSTDFVSKSARKKGTMGELFDKSRELSEKREKERGVDSIKEKYYENYSKVRKGKIHAEKRKENLKESLKGNKHFEVDI